MDFDHGIHTVTGRGHYFPQCRIAFEDTLVFLGPDETALMLAKGLVKAYPPARAAEILRQAAEMVK